MTPEELRLECLRLALKDYQGNSEKVVERAEAFYRYLSNRPSLVNGRALGGSHSHSFGGQSFNVTGTLTVRY
ncbi:hypothetical protein [Paenochrobactrum glaciei]|uniref:Uncharacterized protein n=1 Tax=Paenochrobactrum glaciei TaxID=486407 RepID=A0ABN1GK78_9HYPH